jgi:hypothetical protein
MAVTQRPRHAEVMVLGVLFLIEGLGLLIGGVATVAFWAAVHFGHVPPDLGLPGAAPPIAQSMIAFPRYAWAAGLLMFIFGGLTLAGAVAFLSLRAWGRSVLEAVTWAGMLLSAAFGFWWAAGWLQLTAWARQHESSGGPPLFADALGVAVGAAVMFVGIIVAAFLIYFLRSRAVREAMGG